MQNYREYNEIDRNLKDDNPSNHIVGVIIFGFSEVFQVKKEHQVIDKNDTCQDVKFRCR
jgi:hypothetical protein